MSDVNAELIPLEFANREQELQVVLNKSHSLVLVDAPAGYGKTALFEEVRKRYDGEACKCPIIDLSKYHSKETIRNEIAKAIGVSAISVENEQKADRNLIAAMGRYTTILMLDSIEQAKQDNLRWLLTQFIPACQDAIKGIAFRVLVASRYGSVRLENNKDAEDLPAILKTYHPVTLSPLSQEVVEQVLKNTVKDTKNPNPPRREITEQNYTEWSKHFMHLSGGHPRSIQKLVTELVMQNYAISLTSDDEKDLFTDFIEEEIDTITRGLEPKEKKVLEVLSIFRIIHLGVVPVLQNTPLPQNIIFPNDAETIIKRLAKLGLIKRDANSPFYSDAIVKNLILARMKIITPQTYREMNLTAQDIYDQWIKDILESSGAQYGFFDRSDLILICVKESLYHYIQRFLHEDLSLEAIAPYIREYSENLSSAFGPDNDDPHHKQQLESILLDKDIFSALKEHGLDPYKVLQKAFDPPASVLAATKLNTNTQVFVSYSWEDESSHIVDELEQAFAKQGIRIGRDKKDVGYKDSIDEFERRIGQGQCIVLVISDKFLRSKHCMYELMLIDQNQNLRERIFPIVLDDAKIYDAIGQLGYIKYWEGQIGQLNDAMKEVGVMTNMTGITTDLDKYASIRASFNHLTDPLRDMNALTPEIHAASGFSTLINAVKSEMAKNKTVVK